MIKTNKSVYKNIISNVLSVYNKKTVIERQINVKSIYSKKRRFMSTMHKKNKYIFILFNFLLLILNLIKNIKLFSQNNNNLDSIYIAKTQNQFNSLLPYYNLDDSCSKAFYTYGKDYNVDTVNLELSFLNILEAIKKYICFRQYFKDSKVKNNLFAFQIYQIPSFTYIFYNFLVKNKIKKIFISSEQDIETFILQELAKTLKIRIYYIQHAHIGTAIMSHTLDYTCSFLDGQNIIDIYKDIDPYIYERKIILTGILKILGKTKRIEFVKYNQIYRIGISIGSVFTKLSLKQYITQLCQNLKSNIIFIIRQHPGKRIDEYYFNKEELPKNINLEYSDSRLNTLEKYLSNIDLNISPVSSVHQDIVNLGVISLYCQLNNEEDIYLFSKNGLIKEIMNISDITQDIIDYYTTDNYIRIIKSFNYNYLENKEKIEEKIINEITLK